MHGAGSVSQPSCFDHEERVSSRFKMTTTFGSKSLFLLDTRGAPSIGAGTQSHTTAGFPAAYSKRD